MCYYLSMANRPAQTQSDGSQGPYNVLESTDGGAQMAGEPTACVIVQGGDGRREMGVVQMGTQARQALDVARFEDRRHSRRARAKAHLE